MWERVNLGFVSAYVVVRSGEAIVVDTGNPGSEGSIEAALTKLSVGWSDVGHLILTHRHGDHIGSVDAVMAAASAATAYAGAGDIPNIAAPRAITAVGDGDTVAGLEVVATPGHTPGHICLLDRGVGLLIVGDAMVGEAGGVAGPVPRFADDLPQANASVVKLAGLEFDAMVFGHGEPVLAGASGLVSELAAGL